MEQLLKMLKIETSETGFTLIELLVAVAISGIVMAGIYSAYYSQQRSYVVQEQVVALQQNLRAAMYFMEREVRMAGLDPEKSGNFTIQNATLTSFRFQEDISDDLTDDDDSDGDPYDDPDGMLQLGSEDITYSLDISGNLERTTQSASGPNPPQTLAKNIEVLNFVYLDADGSVVADTVTDKDDIASVQIAIVARSDKTDPKYTNTQTFKNLQGTDMTTASGDSYPLNDHCHREILTAQVKFRNFGLE